MFAYRRSLRAEMKFGACRHGGGRPRVGEVPYLLVVKKASFYMQQPVGFKMVSHEPQAAYNQKWRMEDVLWRKKRHFPFIGVLKGGFSVAWFKFDLFWSYTFR